MALPESQPFDVVQDGSWHRPPRDPGGGAFDGPPTAVQHIEGEEGQPHCRAIAVLMVVIFYAGIPMPSGFLGEDVVFVISGFVITAMLHRE